MEIFFFFNQCDPGDTAYNNLHIDKFRCRSGFFFSFGPTQNLRGLSAAAEYPIPLTFFFLLFLPLLVLQLLRDRPINYH